MTLPFIAVEAVLLVGIVFVAWLVGKGASHRVLATVLCIVYGIAATAATGVLLLSAINYRMPAAWIAAIVGSLGVLAVLIVLIGRDLGWKVSRMVGLLGLLGIGAMGFFVFMYSPAGTDIAHRMHIARAAQIGDALGFVPLVPADADMPVDTLPVDELPGAEEGITFLYQGFELHERKAAGPASEADLLRLVAPGAGPMGALETIPDDAQVTRLTIDGAPAIGVQFAHQSEDGTVDPSAKVTVFVTVIDGVDVRFWSAGVEKYSGGEWQNLPAITPEGFAEIARTLVPLE